jgi:hypothetical protein
MIWDLAEAGKQKKIENTFKNSTDIFIFTTNSPIVHSFPYVHTP